MLQWQVFYNIFLCHTLRMDAETFSLLLSQRPVAYYLIINT